MMYVVLLVAIGSFTVGGSEFLRRARNECFGKMEYPLFVSVVSLAAIVLAIMRITGIRVTAQ